MTKSVIRLVTLAMFLLALIVARPIVPAFADGSVPDPFSSPPSSSSSPSSSAPKTTQTGHKTKKKATKQSSIDPAFVQGYRAAYATIYDRYDYAAAIEQLKALGHEDNANVANLIGYSYRKLGDYKLSQVWYERALKADPNHVPT